LIDEEFSKLKALPADELHDLALEGLSRLPGHVTRPRIVGTQVDGDDRPGREAGDDC